MISWRPTLGLWRSLRGPTSGRACRAWTPPIAPLCLPAAANPARCGGVEVPRTRPGTHQRPFVEPAAVSTRHLRGLMAGRLGVQGIFPRIPCPDRDRPISGLGLSSARVAVHPVRDGPVSRTGSAVVSAGKNGVCLISQQLTGSASERGGAQKSQVIARPFNFSPEGTGKLLKPLRSHRFLCGDDTAIHPLVAHPSENRRNANPLRRFRSGYPSGDDRSRGGCVQQFPLSVPTAFVSVGFQ